MKNNKFIVNNQSEFDKAIGNKANKILEDYKKLDQKKHQTSKKNSFKSDLRTKYENLETDKKYYGVLSAIQKIDEDFDRGQTFFEAIKIYLETSELDSNEVLEYLIEYYSIIKAMRIKIPAYDEKCEQRKIKKQLTGAFVLNDKKITKIDFIRLINALWEMKAFKNKDDSYPTKQLMMKEFGTFVGIDLSKYEKDLSKAVNTSNLETNLEIFERIKNEMNTYFNKKLEKNKNK